MKPLTLEWVDKAEGDWSAASTLRESEPPHYEHAAYLSQQSAEKYLKAVLQQRDNRFPFTHDLARLVALMNPSLRAMDALVPQLKELTQIGLLVRYPSFALTQEQAQGALETARRVRDACRAELGLPPD